MSQRAAGRIFHIQGTSKIHISKQFSMISNIDIVTNRNITASPSMLCQMESFADSELMKINSRLLTVWFVCYDACPYDKLPLARTDYSRNHLMPRCALRLSAFRVSSKSFIQHTQYGWNLTVSFDASRCIPEEQDSPECQEETENTWKCIQWNGQYAIRVQSSCCLPVSYHL